MSKNFVLPIALLTLLLGGCAVLPNQNTTSATPTVTESLSEAKATIASETRSPTPSTSAIGKRAAVVWADYDAGTQREIDLLTSSKDCLGIKSFLGMATATESSVRAKTGHGNELLVAYLNEALSIAGCG